MTDLTLDFSYALGEPEQVAGFKTELSDFKVKEDLGFELTGSGEHFYLHIEKIDENTDWVAKKLSQYFGLKKMDVGYAGKKDRFSVSSQWFSLYLPGVEHTIDWPAFIEQSEINGRLLDSGSHAKKLKLGDHAANEFSITLRGLTLDAKFEERLNYLKTKPVPNYFGDQRFGRDGGNLVLAQGWIDGDAPVRNRNLKGLVLSAVRSYLFNLVVSRRVSDSSWLTMLEGECAPAPSAPLWGRGRALSSSALEALEVEVFDGFSNWLDFLEHRGLSQERRSTALQAQNFKWGFDNERLTVEFTLAPGQFATSVLRELAKLHNPNQIKPGVR